ncbi:hypothetical protein [Leptolyngbya iicbica]|uniref:Cobalt transporter n=2 Tax=Cyanophyceae TaxID=3028117 RepID=A0A4Q7EFE5_9CYAN|nr:hypothetical protein [Leptolyngbya sp. LK]RZM81952.1 hypothetical protein DYY88_01375 [Leptolyngbya sp. LK]
MRWVSRLTLGAAGLLTVSTTQLAVAHTGHPHGEAADTPTADTPTTDTPEPESHSSPLHADALVQEIAHPYGAVMVPAVQLAEQVDFTAIAALTDDSPIAQLASPEGLVGLGETLFCLMLGTPLLLYLARDRGSTSA